MDELTGDPQPCCAALQALNGGQPTWFGINIPFDLNTLLLIVSLQLSCGRLVLDASCCSSCSTAYLLAALC